jgi:hypothetical protein
MKGENFGKYATTENPTEHHSNSGGETEGLHNNLKVRTSKILESDLKPRR